MTGAVKVIEEFEIMIGIVLTIQSAGFKSSVISIFQCLKVLSEDPETSKILLSTYHCQCFEKIGTYSASKHGIGTHAKATRSNLQFLDAASAGELPQS